MPDPTLIDRCVLAVCERGLHWRRCVHWKANLLLTITSAIAAAYALRWLLGVYAVVLPWDSWAGELAMQAVAMSKAAFGYTVGIAAMGGVTSLLHELRADATKLSFINALGHMFAAQFAGLLMYLLAVEWGMSETLALVACGLAGWGGNKSITMLNDRVLQRVLPGKE